MTIANTSNSNLFLGNGATSVFSFTFVADSAQYVVVTYTDPSGNQTILTPSQYSLFINPAASDAIWGVGGTVTYPISGTPIATGSSLTVERILPITQLTSIEDQGNFDPQVIESALDTQCMEIQQLSNSVTRSIQIPAVDPSTINVILPAAAARANQALLFDSSGNVIVGGVTSGSVVISAAMIPVVEAATITEAANLLGVSPSTYIATTVGGTANAIVVTATSPSNFQLVDGVLLTVTPPFLNTGTATLAVGTAGVPFATYKVGGLGLIPLQSEDIGGFPAIFQFSTNINGLGTSGWIGLTILLNGRINYLSTNYTTSAADIFQIFVCTAAINFTLPATTAVFPYQYEDLNAEGGAMTLIPNGTDRINGVNAHFVIPKGGSGRLITDVAGNWYINFLSTMTTQPVIGTYNDIVFFQNGSSTANFSVNEIVLGAALGGQTIKLSSLSGLSLNIATTGAGGMDTGTATASAPLYIYLIYNSTTSTASILATNSAGTTVYSGSHMPSGYTYSVFVSAIMMNGSSQFAAFYQLNGTVFFPSVALLSSGSATSTTVVAVPTLIPPQARWIGGMIALNNVNMSLTISGTATPTGPIAFNSNNAPASLPFSNLFIVNGSTQFFYIVSAGSANVSMTNYTLF